MRHISSLSMLQIVQPCCDCAVEVFDGPGGFTVQVVFAAVPSADVAQALKLLPAFHPGLHSLEAEVESRVSAMEEMTGKTVINHPRFDNQRSHYNFTSAHIYDPVAFGNALSDYLKTEFGLSVNLLIWGDEAQSKQSYTLELTHD